MTSDEDTATIIRKAHATFIFSFLLETEKASIHSRRQEKAANRTAFSFSFSIGKYNRP